MVNYYELCHMIIDDAKKRKRHRSRGVDCQERIEQDGKNYQTYTLVSRRLHK